MSINHSSIINSKKPGPSKGAENQGVTYQEPTYHLHLTPLKAQQSAYNESLASKKPSYQSLDHLVDQVIHERYKDEWKTFSPSKQKEIRKQLAHSLMNRSDQKSSMTIQKPLAEAQGLTQKVADRLQEIINQSPPLQKKIDLTPLIDLLFSPLSGKIFSERLALTLTMVLGSNPSLSSLKNNLFQEVITIQKELRTLTDATMTYIRPPQTTDGHSYVNHLGETVVLSQTIPSSYDRDHPDVQNARLNLNQQGHVIYSTGRIETERKAHQVIDALIQHTLNSGQITENQLIPQGDGSYLYPIVIDNMINPSPIGGKERNYLQQQDATLKKLQGQVKYGRLKDGRIVKLVLQPIHFSTHSNYNSFLGQSNGWTSTGSDLSEKISQEGLESLTQVYLAQKTSLDPEIQTPVEACLKALRDESVLQNRFILRAFICELLQIPYHINCKSSKDRTAILAAIKKALHQWLRLECWKVDGALTLSDPRELLNNPIFREYSEAALFENLPMTDQGTGFSGALDGNEYTQNRGFDYRFSVIENPFPSLVLTDRYLHTASTASWIASAVITSILSVVATAIYVALSPIILIVLWSKFKDQAWEVAKYIFLSLLLLPARSLSRQKWLNHDSIALKERSFFKTHHPSQTAPSLQSLFNQIQNLSSDQQKELIRFVETADPTYLQSIPEHESIFRDIANHWLILQRQLKSKQKLPTCLRTIIEKVPYSPVVLFQYLKNLSQEVMVNYLEKSHICWPTENYVQAIIRKGITEGPIRQTQAFKLDFHRENYSVRGKSRTYDLPVGYKGDKIGDFAHALQDLSVFKECKGIPFPVQELLTQKTVLNDVITPLALSIGSMPPNNSHRTLILEEGDASFFWLTIKEKCVIPSLQPYKNTLSFEYNYSFKISKESEDEWTTTLVAFSPMQPTIEEYFDPALLGPSIGDDASQKIFETTCGMIRNEFLYNLEAAAVWSPKSLLPIEAVQQQLIEKLHLLSTKFSSQLPTSLEKTHQAFEQALKNAKTAVGKDLIIQAWVSYLKLFSEDQIIDMLVKNPSKSVQKLSEDKTLFSRVLKTVLSSKNYQNVCSQLALDPHAKVYSDLQGIGPNSQFSKEMKYRHFFAHFIQLLQGDTWQKVLETIQNSPESPLKTQCLQLHHIILHPIEYADARQQYQAFVTLLRSAYDLAQQGTEDDVCVTFIKALAYERYAGVKLYDYCLGLVELVSGKFEEPITLENFWAIFQAKNERIRQMPKSENIHPIARILQEISGHLNVFFDAALKSNLPYIYGKISLNHREITVLRHGAPIAHHDPFGIFKKLFRLLPGPSVPAINSDYQAFKKSAKDQNQNVLHIILENSEWVYFPDESGRVRARVGMEDTRFFPLALRMDGPFIRPTHYEARSIKDVKADLLQQLLGDLDTTGFSIPQNMKDAYGSDNQMSEAIKACMKTVQEMYFSDQTKLKTLEEFQAFVFLTYAELTLSLCEQLEIDILEAGCKDDIDRGGAFKAILVLHHLHKTDNLNPQKLQELMVNVLAAPMIVKKQPIVPGRGKFIENVLQVVKRARNRS